jgi:hypothetical protein
VQLTPLSTHTHWAPREIKIKKGTIFFGHPVYLYTESCLAELFAVVESVTDGDAVPSPASILPQDQRSNLPVVRKKERDYMGMFEYRKEDEHIIVKHLIHGTLFVCLWCRKMNNRRNDAQ